MNANKFNQLAWHDSELCEVIIDRRNPGERDIVTIDVKWHNNEISRIVFEDCYELEIRMNFGVIAPESILKASCTEKSDELDALKNKWIAIGIDINSLKCFEITTNSTSSVLRVYAINCTAYDG